MRHVILTAALAIAIAHASPSVIRQLALFDHNQRKIQEQEWAKTIEPRSPEPPEEKVAEDEDSGDLAARD